MESAIERSTQEPPPAEGAAAFPITPLDGHTRNGSTDDFHTTPHRGRREPAGRDEILSAMAANVKALDDETRAHIKFSAT